MTDPKPAPRRPRTPPASRPRAVDLPEPVTAECNLPGCTEPPEWRGLCSAHRMTHRGFADPKEAR